MPLGIWWLARPDHVSKPILEGSFESGEYSFVRNFLRPGMTVLDIGSHNGLYSLLASKLVGAGGRVVAFEPSPREQRALRLHLRINRCRNVSVEGLALSDSDSEVELFVVQEFATGCNSLRSPAKDVRSNVTPIRVRSARLDSWLAATGTVHVDFVKLDVEGAELAVLRGAESMLSRQPRPVILAEVQDTRTEPWGYRAIEIIEHLREREFEWFHLRENAAIEELDPGQREFDGNLIACPRESLASFLQRGRPLFGSQSDAENA
jgi:FkbM family methyltransferase